MGTNNSKLFCVNYKALTEQQKAAATFTTGAFILPGLYVITAGDVSGDSLGWDFIHISERENKQAFPKRSTQLEVPEGGTLNYYLVS